MKILRLRNIRLGVATNSSSVHSVFINKNNLKTVYDDVISRCNNARFTSKQDKIDYIHLIGKHTLSPEVFKKFKTLYPKYNKLDIVVDIQGEELLDMNYELDVKNLIEVIENPLYGIFSGGDESAEYSDLQTVLCKSYSDTLQKNGNYYIMFNYSIHYKTRYSGLKQEKLIPEHPELIDLKITNKCYHKCNFCYQGSDMYGKHMEMSYLTTILDKYKDKHIEFALGGGDVLSHPNLDTICKMIKDSGNHVCLTITYKDIYQIIHYHKELLDIVEGIGISISSLEEYSNYLFANGVEIPRTKFTETIYQIKSLEEHGIYTLAHIIPEILDVTPVLNNIIPGKRPKNLNTLLLGLKRTGRGINYSNKKIDISDYLKYYGISVDTQIAKTYKEEILELGAEESITFTEGEFSMYIDGVTQQCYKSSYELDKPYELDTAFTNIRRDNGFEVYNNIHN